MGIWAPTQESLFPWQTTNHLCGHTPCVGTLGCNGKSCVQQWGPTCWRAIIRCLASTEWMNERLYSIWSMSQTKWRRSRIGNCKYGKIEYEFQFVLSLFLRGSQSVKQYTVHMPHSGKCWPCITENILGLNTHHFAISYLHFKNIFTCVIVRLLLLLFCCCSFIL